MTSINLSCTWPNSYWHVTREYLDDSKRYAINKRTQEIVELLQDQLDRNKTRTMTFTDDGLTLAIKMITELYL